MITFILSLTAIFGTSLGPILAANTLTLSLWFKRDFTYIALLTGYFLLGVGVSGCLFVPSGRIWGKRHLFLLGTAILIGSSAWAGAVGRNYTSILWARIIQGVGCAPFEAFVNAAIADLYFVHERGKRMAFTNLAVFGGAFFTPILVGKITHTLMWWWTFYFVAIFCAACLPAIFFFCPETAYRRDASLNTDMLAQSNVKQPTRKEHNASSADGNEARHELEATAQKDRNADGSEVNGELHKPEETPTDSNANGANANDDLPEPAVNNDLPEPVVIPRNEDEKTVTGVPTDPSATEAGMTTPAAHIPSKKTFVQSLALFDGRKTDESFWKLFLRPFPLILHPAFLWAMLIQGTLIGWTVFIGVILAAVFLGPPLFWTEVDTGYSYTGAFIGAILGFIISGALSDWSAAALTRANKGIYEPEFRIVLVIPQMIFGVAGIFGFGYTSQAVREQHGHWAVPVMFFAFEVCGMVIGAVAGSLYIVDAYRDLTIEGFTCLMIFKNFFSFALTWYAYDWVVKGGILRTFNTIGIVQVIVCLLSIPMCE